MKMNTVSGAAMAAAAASLFMSGAVMAPTTAGAKAAMGHCMGVNACKGQGFTMASKGKCMKAGGTFEKA